jgi:DNA-binding IclR family transcriptional regulator
MDGSERSNVPVKAVERTLELVAAIQQRNGATVTTLAADLGVAKSTVHNHLRTLENRGYLVREGEDYRIGLRFVDHGGFALDRKPAYGIVQPKVAELAAETEELCQFVVEQQGVGVVLFQARGSHAVETQFRLGSHAPLHSIPAGKALLARLARERVEAIIDRHGLPEATPATITDRDSLLTELDRIDERGYAINRAEHVNGLRALSATVVSSSTKPLGAFSIVGPSHRLADDRREREIADELLEAVNEAELNVTYARR